MIKPITFLVEKSRNRKIFSKTIRFTYFHHFTVISCVEELGLIHTCVVCADYSYSHIQFLVFELNDYTLIVFITERRFVMILY